MTLAATLRFDLGSNAALRTSTDSDRGQLGSEYGRFRVYFRFREALRADLGSLGRFFVIYCLNAMPRKSRQHRRRIIPARSCPQLPA